MSNSKLEIRIAVSSCHPQQDFYSNSQMLTQVQYPPILETVLGQLENPHTNLYQPDNAFL